jgi:CDP-glucose 4,6-dehydratase
MGQRERSLESLARLDPQMTQINPRFWQNKRVFITGHTGFKGSWLSLWLTSLGATIKGYSLALPTSPSLFQALNLSSEIDTVNGDIRDLEALKCNIKLFNPDILIHMAAQPLVRLSYRDPTLTFSTNVMGTVNILEAARVCNNLKAIVNVTSDKCYENREWGQSFNEEDHMGGYDPYSSSKGCAELVTSAYRRSFFSQSDTAYIASARAGNVIGWGDWSEDRLVPDIFRSIDHKVPLKVRNLNSVRPWQHVLEPLSGYLILAEKLFVDGESYSEGWNFGPNENDVRSVKWVLDYFVEKWGDQFSYEHETQSLLHEAQLLKLDTSKARSRLQWHPRWSTTQALDSITEFHNTLKTGINIRDELVNQINRYCEGKTYV